MEENVKKNVYVCITESLCYTVEINNIVNQFFFKKRKLLKQMHSLFLYRQLHGKINLKQPENEANPEESKTER